MQLIARKLVLSVVLISSVFAQSAISAESAAPAFSPSDSGPTPETTMVGFFRWYSSGPFMHRSDPYGVNPPPPFGLEEELGQIPTTNVAGSHPLYNCFHTPRVTRTTSRHSTSIVRDSSMLNRTRTGSPVHS